MADLQTLLALIPDGPEYQMLKDALARVARTFPEQMAEITADRVSGWVNEIGTGTPSGGVSEARDASQIRNDIFKYIVGEDVIMSTLGVDRQTAQNLINQTGGAQFALFEGLQETGSLTADTYGAPLTLVYGQDMQWYFDPRTNKYYVAYGMPNSDLTIFFEAEADQITALFGEGGAPPGAISTSLSELTARQNFYFGGNVSEMEGTGSFEAQIERIMATSFDTSGLPDWMKADQKALDIVFIAQMEGKSSAWIIEQVSKLDSFKARFPNIQALVDLNLTMEQAVNAFLEYESKLTQLARQFGTDESTVTPDVVGNLIGAGYSAEDVAMTFSVFKRMQDYAPALQAFNEVLMANGMAPLTPEDQFDFLTGNAPQEVYDIYEATNFREQATAAGLGDALSAQEAIDLALITPGMTRQESIAQGMQQAAQFALRMRAQIDLGEFGLDIDDIIDVSLGVAPRSGTLMSEVNQALSRAVSQAKAFVDTERAAPFTNFTRQGIPQQTSLTTLRPER